ncbi:MAG: hypothetical protein AAF221_02650 [Pseudomonadota bacterium]
MMAEITFVLPDGSETKAELKPGMSLMEVAVKSGIEQIEARCGGACACASCHCYVEAPWADKLPEQDELEAEMLEMAHARKDSSRLSCQVPLGASMDGLVVHVPAEQAQ